ncbi:MAG: bS21 family ribosomal protein [Candidatus Wolfebacteria bacterium]|nr:bS21 family ribosomal protein [Candidatus Wolfebacteria bacterium]
MAISVKRREGESASSFLYRFTKKMQQSGVLREAKKRRFTHRNINKNKRKASALYKSQKMKEVLAAKKLGKF